MGDAGVGVKVGGRGVGPHVTHLSRTLPAAKACITMPQELPTGVRSGRLLSWPSAADTRATSPCIFGRPATHYRRG